MATFPLPLVELLGQNGSYIVYLLIGMAFGATLESAGFGNSMKLAAQVYFRDLTVFKVMFTAIITAMTLLFLSSAVGLVDYNLVWVPPTYLWPGVVGGLIMGVGFIVGGFCPGTSLVGMATGKLDAVFFVGGVLFGIFLFGETVASFALFFESSYYGRFTLPDLLGVSYGAVVLGIVVMALAMFVLTEQLEKKTGGKTAQSAPAWGRPAAAALIVLATIGLVLGQPTSADRWERIAPTEQARLDQREVQITPDELLSLMHDRKLRVRLFDLRSERDFNLFHLRDAELVDPDDVEALAGDLHFEPANTVFVVMSNGEAAATEAWKTLRAESVPNAYLLAGGVNGWLEAWMDPRDRQLRRLDAAGDDEFAWRMDAAIGARHPAAEPNPQVIDLSFKPKVILELKRAPSGGGCG